ncbi:protein of unknown function [Ruminococcaceae bacterium BL-6]|nr:protein of unknown function [Ruminococcaceae bacterium BL-6]
MNNPFRFVNDNKYQNLFYCNLDKTEIQY